MPRDWPCDSVGTRQCYRVDSPCGSLWFEIKAQCLLHPRAPTLTTGPPAADGGPACPERGSGRSGSLPGLTAGGPWGPAGELLPGGSGQLRPTAGSPLPRGSLPGAHCWGAPLREAPLPREPLPGAHCPGGSGRSGWPLPGAHCRGSLPGAHTARGPTAGGLAAGKPRGGQASLTCR